MSHAASVTPRVVSREEWLRERVALLAKEKAMTRQRDELARERRALPWVRIEKDYRFDAPEGEVTLRDLFGGKSQLIVKHFMFGPGWKEGCVGCSFECDHIQGTMLHLPQRDVALVAVSRAPLEESLPFKRRMGWTFPWVSSSRTDFNYDFDVSFPLERVRDGKVRYNYRDEDFAIDELSGFSVFARDERGGVHHTYSAFGRGAEEVLGTYMLLDLTPKGRDETIRGNLTDWVRHHDRYGAGGSVATTGRYVEEGEGGKPCCGRER